MRMCGGVNSSFTNTKDFEKKKLVIHIILSHVCLLICSIVTGRQRVDIIFIVCRILLSLYLSCRNNHREVLCEW